MKLLIEEVSYDSMEEWYFSCWCKELKEAGFIESYERDTMEIPITNGLYNEYILETKLKTKVKFEPKKQTILGKSRYTPDFLITWSEKASMIFFSRMDLGIPIDLDLFIAQDSVTCAFSHVECKPLFDRDNMTRSFIMNQKYIWDKYNKFINLIYPVKLFKYTFAPKEYMTTPTGKPRKFSYHLKTLEEYIDMLKKKIY